MPKVSVCLPVYNGERFLAQAIESVLGQSYRDFELLIADDRSSDGSFAIAQRFALSDPRVHAWSNRTNLGLFANYNNCIQRAQGDFIKLFAQDDLLEPDALQRLVKALETNPQAKLVSCGRRWIGPDSQELQVVRPFPDTRIIPGTDVIRYNLVQLGNWVGEPSTTMFRRADAGEGFDTRFHHYGDIEYWFRIVESGDYLYLDDVLCSFRRHPESSTTSNLAGLFFVLDILLLGKKYRRYSEALGESEEHFLHRALEVAARHVHHLSKDDQLTADDVAAIEKGKPEDQSEQLRQFKELGFHALTYLSELLAERHSLLCTIQDLDEMVHDVKANPWWRATKPLRQLSGKQVSGVDPNFPKISSGKPAQGVVVVP
jgi:glycosyltransferase involved in cell wall biosynthesis